MIVIFGASFFENNPNPYLPSKSTSQEHGYLIDNYNYDDDNNIGCCLSLYTQVQQNMGWFIFSSISYY